MNAPQVPLLLSLLALAACNSTVATVGNEAYLVFPHFTDQDPPTVERVNWNAGAR
jgi:hypothetical protein